MISTNFVGNKVFLHINNYEFQVVVPPIALENDPNAAEYLAKLLYDTLILDIAAELLKVGLAPKKPLFHPDPPCAHCQTSQSSCAEDEDELCCPECTHTY